MNDLVKDKMKEFISLIKKEFNDKIHIGYSYDSDDDIFRIWHTNSKFDLEEFRMIIGKYIRICFFENNIFNISIAYDKYKANEITKKYNACQYIAQPQYLSFKVPEKRQYNKYNIKTNNRFKNSNSNFDIKVPYQKITLNRNLKTNISAGTLEVA